MAFVYILLSEKDHRSYVGSTIDLERRIEEHNSGRVMATRNRRPLKLLYQEEYEVLGEARLREKYLKTASGRRYLKKQFNHWGIAKR